jgi:hypothetical protein
MMMMVVVVVVVMMMVVGAHKKNAPKTNTSKRTLIHRSTHIFEERTRQTITVLSVPIFKFVKGWTQIIVNNTSTHISDSASAQGCDST